MASLLILATAIVSHQNLHILKFRKTIVWTLPHSVTFLRLIEPNIFEKLPFMKLSLSPDVKPGEPYQFLASSSTGIENDAEEVVERGEKAATHLTNHPNSFKHKFRTKISHKSDTKRTTVTVLPPRFKSQLAFGQTTTTQKILDFKDSSE